MRRRRRLSATLAAALSIAVLLSACGGGEQGAAGEREPAGETSTGTGTTSREQVRTDVKTGPLRVTGSGAKQYRRQIGSYDALEFGKEASRSELEQVARVAHGYLVAHAEQDWLAACSHLDERAMEEVETLGSSFEEVASEDCPAIIAFLLGKVPIKKTFVSSEVEAGAFRVEGDKGYLFYTDGTGGDPYMMPMSREGGDWKIASITASRVSRLPEP